MRHVCVAGQRPLAIRHVLVNERTYVTASTINELAGVDHGHTVPDQAVGLAEQGPSREAA